MKFLSRELSEELQKRGCVSESIFFWYQEEDGSWQIRYPTGQFSFSNELKAFTAFDLIAPSERARENAKIVLPGILCFECRGNECHSLHRADHPYILPFNGHRHCIVDLPYEDEVEAYIWASLKEAA